MSDHPENIACVDSLRNEVIRLEALFETSSLNYQCTDSQGNLIKVNASWLKSLGYSEDDVLNKWFGDFLSEDSARRFRSILEETVNKNINEQIELQIRCKDQSLIAADFKCLGALLKGDTPTGIHCVFQNITKLRQTEKALEDSERKYSQLVEQANVGIFELDLRSMKFTHINETIKRILGLTNENIGNFKFEDVLSPEGKLDFKEWKSSFRSKEIPSSIIEYEIISQNKENKIGESLWVQINNSYLKDSKGIYKIIGVAQNITERKKLESELQNYHNNLEHITRNSPAVIFQVSIQAGKLGLDYISENISNYIGFNAAECNADPSLMYQRLNKEDLNRCTKILKEAKKENKSAEIEYQFIRRDGETLWIRSILSPQLNEKGEVTWTGVSTDISKEVELREKLRRTEQRFEALVNSASPGISTMSKIGIVNGVNPRICELSGYSEEELLGKHFLQIPAFYTRDALKYKALFKDAQKDIIPLEPYLFEWKHKNGTKRWGEGYLGIMRQDGKKIGYQAVFTDVTGRVLLEKEARERQDDLNFLFEATVAMLDIQSENELYAFLAKKIRELLPHATVEINSVAEDGNSIRIESVAFPDTKSHNRAFKIMGNQLVGRTVPLPTSSYSFTQTGRLFKLEDSLYELLTGNLPKLICDGIDGILGPGIKYGIALGSPKKMVGGAVIFIKEGETIPNPGIIETFFQGASEVLKRIRAVNQLNLTEKQYRSLAESTGDWIIRFNSKFEHVYVNNAVSQAFKKEPAEFAGKTCNNMGYSIEYSRLIEHQLETVFLQGNPSKCDIELQLSNETIFSEWCFYPELSGNGNVESILVNTRDISERNKMEGELLAHLSKKNQLYSIISHDLRAPFNSMLGFLNLVDQKLENLSDTAIRNYLKITKESAESCLNLCNQVLEWSTECNNEDSIKPVYFDLKVLIDQALHFSNASIEEKQIRISNNVDFDTLVYADHNMINTVLRNLFSNAIRYSEKDGNIIISAQNKKDQVVCTIKDFGKGMDPSTLDLVQKGIKAPPTTDNINIKRSGLGLKLSKEFIEHNSGELRIESHLGEGTTIIFSLNK